MGQSEVCQFLEPRVEVWPRIRLVRPPVCPSFPEPLLWAVEWRSIDKSRANSRLGIIGILFAADHSRRGPVMRKGPRGIYRHFHDMFNRLTVVTMPETKHPPGRKRH